MPKETNRRLTIVTLLLATLLLSPLGAARPPVPARDAAEATGNQEITDLALEPTGQFGTTVVRYDGTRSLTPGGLLGGATPQQPATKDIYRCDFGPATLVRAGEGCRGLVHNPPPATGAASAQAVDATSYAGASGLVPVFAVAGPGDVLSYWFFSSDQPRFAKALGDPVVNVSVSPDGSRIAAATAPSAVNSGGRLHLYDDQGNLKWDLNLTNGAGTAARPTGLAFSRDGKLLVVGTTHGLLFLDPHGAKPTRLRDLAHDTDAAVVEVAVSRTGDAVLAGTADGVFYLPLVGGRPSGTVWNRGVPEGVTDVAMSLDGKRFAAATGNRIQFYRHIGGSLIVEHLQDSYDAGARVADLAYDATGSLLVAVAGDSVFGFGPTSQKAPLWTFRATDAARGGLDGPLRKVSLSDEGARLLVGGRTKFMAYTNVVSVTASLAVGASNAVTPGRASLATLTVANTGSLPDNYTFVVKGPVGWSTTSPVNLALDPDQTQQVNFTVEPPAGTAPGLYPILVEVRSRAANGNVLASPQANLSIPRAVSLVVTTDQPVIELRQGQERTAVFTVRNLGNAEGLVNLSATQATSQGPSWSARFDKEQVRLPPGASADVQLTLAAPQDVPSGARNLVTVRAREGSIEASANVTAYVDVEFGASVQSSNSSLEFRPGDTRTLTVTIRNTGNTEDTFNVTYALSPAIAAGDWKVTLAEDLKITLAQGISRTLSISIRPAVAEPRDASLTLRAVSQGSPDRVENSDVVLLQALPAEPTPEEEENPLPAPSLPLLVLAVAAVALALRRGGLR